MQKLAATLLIIGSIGFVVGAFLLAPTGFFDAVDVAGQIAAIENNATFWTLAWLTLPTGCLIAALGIFAQARQFQQTDERKWLYMTAYVVATGAIIGALTYVYNGFGALTVTPERYLEIGNSIGNMLFMTYSVTTFLAVTTFGVLFFLRNRRFLGGFIVVVVILSLVTGMWFVPLTCYIPLLISGIVLLIRPGSNSVRLQDAGLTTANAV
jgi:hypothetical protein